MKRKFFPSSFGFVIRKLERLHFFSQLPINELKIRIYLKNRFGVYVTDGRLRQKMQKILKNFAIL
ncbi:MAG: hypothetical protein EA412_03345 [Chitinophagaceae bacterium]|nr:MAG: hypothetical protein EA412_03345 [Chitinophagaceae bacterium]